MKTGTLDRLHGTPDAPAERGDYSAVVTALWRRVSLMTSRPGKSAFPKATADKAGRLRHGFTLIELLGVMVIAVLLISIGIAGYNEMRKTAGVGTGARMLAGAVSQARQAALTSGRRTRLLISAERYAISREVPNLRINGQPFWETVADWQPTPVGAVCLATLPSLSGIYKMDETTRRVYTNASPLVWYTNSVSNPSSASYSAIEFSREGRPSQTWTVVVARGFWNGSVWVTNSTDSALVIVDGQTGKSRVERK